MNYARLKYFIILVLGLNVVTCFFPVVHVEGMDWELFGPGEYHNYDLTLRDFSPDHYTDIWPIALYLATLLSPLIIFGLFSALNSKPHWVIRVLLPLLGIGLIFLSMLTSFVFTFELFGAPRNLTLTSGFPILLQAIFGLGLIVFGIIPRLFRPLLRKGE